MEWQHDPHTAEPIGTAEALYAELQVRLKHNRVFTDNHLVILCHDEMFHRNYDETELKKFIELVKSNKNYRFASLRDYP